MTNILSSHNYLNNRDTQVSYLLEVKNNTRLLISSWSALIEKQKNIRAHVDLNLLIIISGTIIMQVTSLARVLESNWILVLSIVLSVISLILLLARIAILNSKQKVSLLNAIEDAREVELEAMDYMRYLASNEKPISDDDISQLTMKFSMLVKHAPTSFSLQNAQEKKSPELIGN